MSHAHAALAALCRIAHMQAQRVPLDQLTPDDVWREAERLTART